MTPQLTNVANAFHVGAFALGVPSFCALLPLSFYAIQMRLAKTAPPPAAAPGNEPVSLISLLMSGVRIVGKVAGFMEGFALAITTALACAALAATLIAVLMFYTARGLHSQASWARIVAIALCLLGAAASGLGMLSLRLPFSLAMYAFFAAACYAMWVLFARFSA